jgi:predicted lipid-binding transport protein (Tim44 family)
MALSEREQRLLEELERGLYAEDAEFVQRVSRSGGISMRRMIGGAALAVIGISILIFAVIIQIAVFGVIGFLLMLSGIIVASSNFKQTTPSTEASANSPSRAKDSSSKFSGFEDRWDRRREN